MKEEKKLCSIVVPCYNEEKAIPLYYQEMQKVFIELPELQFEFVFIDDGSGDRTLQVIKELREKDTRVHYVSFSRNFGKEAGIYAGLQHSSGDYVVIMDVDLQDPPDMLRQMYDIIQSGEYDCVAARRVDRKGEPPIRSWFAKLFYKMINKISKTEIVDGARDYRFMTRQMVESILSMSEYNRFSKGIFGWVGFKTKWLSYENVERVAGETKWSFWKLFVYSLEGIVAFSTIPLSIASFFGLFFCIIAFVGTLFIFTRALIFGDPVSGWPSMVCIITLLGGIQLLCMGIMGMYLSKMYLECKNRPIYIAKEEG
ncbi:MAG: glycosyltransferase family 2 protein [Lachnospiraceae bacterium]|nr:glycosyltransferase family 2 protein [Lachnospiraceae bacterium]